MATHTTMRAGSGNTTVSHRRGEVVVTHEIDLADVYDDVSGFASADSLEVFRFPRYTELNGLQVIVVDAVDTDITRIDIGDAGSATRYVNNASTLTAGTVLTQAVTTNPLYFYTDATAANNAILLKITGTITEGNMVGKLRFIARITDMTRSAPSTTQ